MQQPTDFLPCESSPETTPTKLTHSDPGSSNSVDSGPERSLRQDIRNFGSPLLLTDQPKSAVGGNPARGRLESRHRSPSTPILRGRRYPAITPTDTVRHRSQLPNDRELHAEPRRRSEFSTPTRRRFNSLIKRKHRIRSSSPSILRPPTIVGRDRNVRSWIPPLSLQAVESSS